MRPYVKHTIKLLLFIATYLSDHHAKQTNSLLYIKATRYRVVVLTSCHKGVKSEGRFLRRPPEMS